MSVTETEQVSDLPPMVTLFDYFDDYTSLRLANLQPEYGLIQLNSAFKDTRISVDVKVSDLIAALVRLGFLIEQNPIRAAGGSND